MMICSGKLEHCFLLEEMIRVSIFSPSCNIDKSISVLASIQENIDFAAT